MIGVKSKQGSRIGRCGWITSFLRRKREVLKIYFQKENIYDFEKKVFFLLKEEVCYLLFNVFFKSTLINRVSYKRNKN